MNTTNTAVALTKDTAVPAVDIFGFNAVAQCAAGHEFELMHQDGKTGTGIIAVVQGKHSDEVFSWMSANVHKATLEIQMAQKQRKDPKPKTLAEMRDQNIEGASIRMIGWKNVQQPFSRETLKQALRLNPHWIDQIVQESDDLGNFTPKQATDSSTTPEKSSV